MQGDGQFDDAQAGSEMSAGYRDCVDRLRTQFVGDLPELMVLKLSEVGGGRQGIEKRDSRIHY
jgi:hypothetical protein